MVKTLFFELILQKKARPRLYLPEEFTKISVDTNGLPTVPPAHLRTLSRLGGEGRGRGAGPGPLAHLTLWAGAG